MTIIHLTGAGVSATGRAVNAYATLDEIKAAAPNAFTGTSSDAILAMLSERASRLIDNVCHRHFYELAATRTWPTVGEREVWLPDLLAVTSINYSADYGASYTALTTDDYLLYGGRDLRDGETPYNELVLRENGALDCFYVDERGLKIVGLWGYHGDYARAWDDSGDTVQDAAGMTAAQTTVMVTDVDGANLYGLTPRLSVGNTIKIESEQCLVTATNTTTQVASIRRGWNGTTAATHAKAKTVYVWWPEALVQQACCIETVRWFKRGSQGFADASAGGPFGTLLYTKALDPDIVELLINSGLRRVTA